MQLFLSGVYSLGHGWIPRVLIQVRSCAVGSAAPLVVASAVLWAVGAALFGG